MLSLCEYLISAEEISKDGGELLKTMYESDVKSEEIITLKDVKNYKVSIEGTYLANIMETK